MGRDKISKFKLERFPRTWQLTIVNQRLNDALDVVFFQLVLDLRQISPFNFTDLSCLSPVLNISGEVVTVLQVLFEIRWTFYNGNRN